MRLRAFLQARAWAPARMLRKQPRLVGRFTRTLLTQLLREKMQKLLPLGFAPEGLRHGEPHTSDGTRRLADAGRCAGLLPCTDMAQLARVQGATAVYVRIGSHG